MAKSKLEKDLEKDLGKWVKSRGGIYLKVKIDGERGFPDRMILLPDADGVAFCELKRPDGTGRYSPQQEYWLHVLNKFDYVTAFCTSDLEAAKITLR